MIRADGCSSPASPVMPYEPRETRQIRIPLNSRGLSAWSFVWLGDSIFCQPVSGRRPLMLSRLSHVSLAAAVATATVTALAAAPNVSAATVAVAPGNVPSYAAAAARQGAANGSGRLTVSVYLAGSNPSGLAKLVRDLYDKHSPSYHKFLTSAQFRTAYAPAAADVSAVKSFLDAKGPVSYTHLRAHETDSYLVCR